MKTRALAGIGVAAALALTGGCGKAAEKAAEKITERAIEEGAGGANVDISDGGMSFESEDGSFSYQIDDEGNVVMKGEDGETSYTTGGAAEVPDGWPAFLNLPPDAEILASSTSTDGDQKTATVMAEFSGDTKETYEGFKAMLEGEGFEITSDSLTTSSDGSFAVVSAESGERMVSVSVSGNADGTGSISINVTGL